MTSSTQPIERAARAPRGRGRRILRALLLTTIAVVVAALVAAWQWGPRYGVYLVPPSPQAYADQALERMDAGYHARGEAWAKARAQAVADTRGAASYADTLPALRTALAVAGGKHSHLFDAGESLVSSDRDRPLPAIATREGITTLTVPKLSADDEAFRTSYATTLADGIAGASAATTCGFIVDARVNHGGDISPMLAGLSPLLPDGRIGGFVDRHGATTELSVAGGSVRVAGTETFSVPAKPKPHRPVAVLQGPDTASSGEVVVLAFKGGADVRTFGEATAGYSTSNQTIRLCDGTQMLLTTAVDTDRSGATYGDVVKPDQAVPTAQAEQAARAWLAGQCTR